MTDNSIIRKDGATAGHVQESNVTIDDNGSVNIPTGETYDINGTPHTHTGLSTYDSDVIFQAITTGNADSDNHGFLSALSGDSDTWLDGLGTWTTPPGGNGSSLTNSNITPTTTNVTAAVGTRYFADISGLTADRNFVLPTCSAGDIIELKITVGDADYELVIIGDTGVSIEGGTAATEWKKSKQTGEAFRFVSDGSDSWRSMGIIPRGVELDYVEFTSYVSPTATTEGTANTIVTGSAINYDGSTPIMIEFFSPYVRPAIVAGAGIYFWLYLDGSSIGRLADVATAAGTNGNGCPVRASLRLTPTAGSHTYSVRASVSTGTALVQGGAGGAGNYPPGFIRITKANP